MKKINYELYRNNNRKSSAYGKVFARMKHAGTVDIDGLCRRACERHTLLGCPEMKWAVSRMVAEITRLLTEGYKVKLDDLCILSLGIDSRGAESEESFRPSDIMSVHLNVQASGEMRKTMGEIKR